MRELVREVVRGVVIAMISHKELSSVYVRSRGGIILLFYNNMVYVLCK